MGWAAESVKERPAKCDWSEGQAQFTDSEDTTQISATRRACGPAPGENLQPYGTQGEVTLIGVGQEGD